jgi:hypothetical protein
MFWTHYGNKVNFEFDGDIHFLDKFFPILEGKAEYLTDVELLEVIFFLEAS